MEVLAAPFDPWCYDEYWWILYQLGFIRHLSFHILCYYAAAALSTVGGQLPGIYQVLIWRVDGKCAHTHTVSNQLYLKEVDYAKTFHSKAESI